MPGRASSGDDEVSLQDGEFFFGLFFFFIVDHAWFFGRHGAPWTQGSGAYACMCVCACVYIRVDSRSMIGIKLIQVASHFHVGDFACRIEQSRTFSHSTCRRAGVWRKEGRLTLWLENFDLERV